MLVRTPTQCALRDIYVGEGKDPATFTSVIAGATQKPTGFVVPGYQIMERKSVAATRVSLYGKLGVLNPGQQPGSGSTDRYEAQLIVTRRANEGNNTSVYLGKGVYETNYTFDREEYAKAKKDQDFPVSSLGNMANWLTRWENESQPRVYFVMPDEIAEMNRLAETEHCDDMILAYQLTLRALERAVDDVAHAPVPGGQDALISKLRDVLPAGLKDVARNLDLCGQKYLDLCQCSKIRDSRNWHSWGLEYLGPTPLPPSVHYLTERPRKENGNIFLRYTKGQAEVGMHPPAEIINF